jgi:BirA family biotin operon repressor/biotin-[acetyl-CoA-carboxylase] ligase
MTGLPRPPGLPSAVRLHAHARLTSTNDAARRLAQEGAPEATLVWALEQTAGRGRRGRDWRSPPGNLYVTAVLRPDCGYQEAAQLGFAGALALAEAFDAVLPADAPVAVKWPNDVLVRRRKAAGILLETVVGQGGGLDALLLGVGANVAHAPADAAFPATDLRSAGARPDLDPAELLGPLAANLLAWTARWRADGFPPLRSAWLARAHAPGEALQVRLPSGPLAGRFRDLDATGALLLDTAQGVERVAVGDVFFPEAARTGGLGA